MKISNPLLRLWFSLTVSLAAAMACPAAGATDSLPPAPFVPLPVGTVLDYGSFQCTVEKTVQSVHICQGPDGNEARFYAKLVPFGVIPSTGYASQMHSVSCEWGRNTTRFGSHVIKSIVLTPADNLALDSLWPLQIGKKVSFRRNFQPLDGSAKSTIEVAGIKTVAVLGMRRQVYVLKGKTTKLYCDQGNMGSIYTSFDETWLYSPDLAAIVRYDLKWARSDTIPRDYSYELKAFTPSKPPVVAQVRPTSPPATERFSLEPAARSGSTQTSADFSGIHFGKYHAIVIGNNDYEHLTDLRMAVNDARAVAKLLADDYGFEVRLITNAKRSDVIRELAKMRARLTPNDNLLIYYAGHGVVDRVAQVGYWLPVDAENDVPTNWVSTGDLTAMLRAIRAKHVMVVADSCYSGTLVRAADARVKTSRERGAWVKRIVGKRARTALVSGGLEPVADGGGGEHSVFARAFLTALSENRGVIEGEALFDAVKRPVVLNTDQTPQYSDIRKSGHEGGDFLFVRK